MKYSFKDVFPNIPFGDDDEERAHGTLSPEEEDELIFNEQAARDFYCVFNSDRRCPVHVPIEECRILAERYRSISDFATYGLKSFCEKYKLSPKQMRILQAYSNESASLEYHRFDGRKIADWYSVSSFVEDLYHGEIIEIVLVFYVNDKCEIIGTYSVKGDETSAVIDSSNVMRYAPYCGTYGVFLVHNHPFSIALPSDNDIRRTMIIDYTVRNMGIKLLDSLIVANYGVFSMLYNKYMLLDPRVDIFRLIREHILNEDNKV